MPHHAFDRRISSFLFVSVLVATLAAALVAVPLSGSARAQSTTFDRVAGDDRIATAVAASQHTWASADEVIVTVSDDYPDALAAGAYASAQDAPVLLTDAGQLSAEVAGEIDRLGADRVTLLGGATTVDADVEAALAEIVPEVRRVAGATRYDTAAELATVVGTGDGDRVAVALGTASDVGPGWPDALSAGSLAALDDPIPTLLTDTDELPEATAAALRELDPSEVLLIGGENAVGASVADDIAATGAAVRRVAGTDRWATSLAVADVAFGAGLPRGDFVFVSGQSFADALGGAAVAASHDAPMLLVPSERLDNDVNAYLRAGGSDFTTGLLVGGGAAVGEHVAAELEAALAGTDRPAPPAPPEPEPEPEAAAASYDGYTFRFPLSTWDALARCESSGNWSINTGNGYYGGIQFSLSSWRAVGGTGYPHQSSRLEQIYRGEKLQAIQGWGAWPACSRKLGLR